MKNFYTKIEFWIILLFLIRLVGITNPPIEISNNWRQATGLMVARNFLEENNNILYPRVDETNGHSGIIGMEFPSMNYLYYLIASVFGYTHWYGRLINLIVSSFGLLFFFKLLELAGFSKRISFLSTLLLSSSIWFCYSRKMMPDTYCVSLMFIALYFGIRYLYEKKNYFIFIYIVIASLAILSKIPAGIYFIVPLLYFFNHKIQLKKRIVFVLASIPPLIVTYYWYFIWNFFLSKNYGNWYNSGVSFKDGFLKIINNLDKVAYSFYFDSFFSYIVFTIFCFGLIMMIIKRNYKLLLIFSSFLFIYIIYMFKSGQMFFQSYYIIPFVPVMALIAGYSLSLIKYKFLAIILLISGMFEGIANQSHDFFIKKSELYKMSITSIINKISNKNDLIAISENQNPQLLYLSHRKGWVYSDKNILDKQYLKKVIQNNGKFLVIDRHSIDSSNLNYFLYPIAFKNNDFIIFNISN